MRLTIYMMLIGIAAGRDNDWQPILPDSTLNFPTYVKTPLRTHEPSSLKILNRPSSHYSYPTIGGGNSLNSLFNVAPAASESESCSIHKVSMNQELPNQYIEYENKLPDLKEFTLCMWTKFHNHSQDHPLFSYSGFVWSMSDWQVIGDGAPIDHHTTRYTSSHSRDIIVSDSPKEISAWVSNNAQASFLSMAIHGQTFFRLNYPLKLNKWYHSCQSWNGRTGEWQIWVNAERVGRGFHNRLVGHIIKGGGIAVSGQEQSLAYSKGGQESFSKQSGFLGEITMVQVYHVALTAGKAHKDHKHHHVHHFRHDGTPIEATTEAVTEPPPPVPVPIGNGNFLIGGQLQLVPNYNLAGQQPQQMMIPVQLPNGIQYQQPFVNGQLGNRLVSEQLVNSVHQNQRPISVGLSEPSNIPVSNLQPEFTSSAPSSIPTFGLKQSFLPAQKTSITLTGALLHPANVQYISDNHNIFRRDSKKRDKRDNPEKEIDEKAVTGKKEKRGLVALSDGSVVDEALLSPTLSSEDTADDTIFKQSLLNGLAGFERNVPIQNEQKEKEEREPAEAEVKAVMQVCSGCAPEPFKKALVLSWRTTPKKLYSGAHYYKGLPICKAF